LRKPKIKPTIACENSESTIYEFLFEEVDKIMLSGLNEDNIDASIQLIEALKSKEKIIRMKRQSLETLVYHNIHLLVKRANQM
jgi:hypothetical protein